MQRRGHNTNNRGNSGQPEEHRLVMPRGNEVIGVVTKALGASKFAVLCSDNRERVCAIPGRFRRNFWIKERDMVLVKPWIVQGDEKGDVIYRYSVMDKESLKSHGFNIPQV